MVKHNDVGLHNFACLVHHGAIINIATSLRTPRYWVDYYSLSLWARNFHYNVTEAVFQIWRKRWRTNRGPWVATGHLTFQHRRKTFFTFFFIFM